MENHNIHESNSFIHSKLFWQSQLENQDEPTLINILKHNPQMSDLFFSAISDSRWIHDHPDLSLKALTVIKGSQLSVNQTERKCFLTLLNSGLIKRQPEELLELFEELSQQGNNDLAMALFDMGLTTNTRRLDGQTPLHLACRSGNLPLIKELHNKAISSSWLAPIITIFGTIDDVPDHSLSTPIHYAAALGRPDIVAWLIDSGANVNGINQEGHSPLFLACQSGNSDSVQLLLDQDADVRIVTLLGQTPLEMAMLSHINLETRSRLEIRDGGWTQEILMRELLAHRFGIKGTSQLTKESQPFALEGFTPISALNYLCISSLPFYQHLSDRLEPVQSLSKVQIEQVARTVYFTLNRSMAYLTDTGQRLLDDLDLGLSIPLLGTWVEEAGAHTVAAVISKIGDTYFLTRCNKGSHHQGKPGIRCQAIAADKVANLPFFFESFRNLTPEFFTTEVEEILGLSEEEFDIPQKEQKIGNCTVANSNSLELAILFVTLGSILDNSVQAATLAQQIQKMRTDDSRTGSIKEYLALHPSPQTETFPPDFNLLTHIFTKPPKDLDAQPERQRLIREWAKNYGIKTEL